MAGGQNHSLVYVPGFDFADWCENKIEDEIYCEEIISVKLVVITVLI
jgi:hypothetical protein